MSPFGMEANGDGAPDTDQTQLTDAVRHESNREKVFVAGYMALMSCSERAARAVYMYRHVNGADYHVALAA